MGVSEESDTLFANTWLTKLNYIFVLKIMSDKSP
jgi:hypothetical protein